MKKKMALFLILSMCMLGTATVHATESADGSQTENQSDSQDAGTENQKSGWQVEDGGWYYYADGQRATGWLYLPDGTYYLDESTGAMQTGWLNDDGTWYYLQESGRRAYGWINLDAWYYLDWNTGVMLTGEQEIDGQTYYLDASGRMCEDNWVQREDGWYYYGPGGMKSYGWLLRWDGWYYLDTETGRMMNGAQEIGGHEYRFNASGHMYENQWIQEDGNWYFYNVGGAKAKNGWTLDGQTWYYMDAEGVMQTGWLNLNGTWYYLHSNGAMASATWLQLGGEWYYVTGSGNMVTGWNQINGMWYYMYENGVMAHDTVIDGYELDSSGAWNAGLAAANAAAQGVIALAGNDLYSCYRWIVDNCTYQSFYEETPAGYTWQEWRAVQMFNNRYGDCHSFAALFGYTARALGYDAQIISGYTTSVSGKWVDHGWVEINGAIYDPDLEYELGYNCFGQSPFSYKYYL